MKKIYFSLICSLLYCSSFYSQNTCAAPLTVTSGACITNQAVAGTSGLTSDGCSPDYWLYLKFTAGSCNQFTVTMNGGAVAQGLFYILTTGCSYISGTAVCADNLVANVPFNLDQNGVALTPGTQYIMVLGVNFPNVMGSPVAQTFNVCFNANVAEASSNECSGAAGLGNISTVFSNGGSCSYSGSLNDATTSDPAAAQLCAGSLENTQWVKFTPTAGATSFSVVGSSINCIGGGCGFQFGIFSGTCGSLTNEGCYGNKVCSGGQSTAGPTNVTGNLYNLTWSGTSNTGFTAVMTTTNGSTFTGTEVFYLVMDGNANSDCQYTLTGFNLTLPVELIYFNGYRLKNSVKLDWVTLTEKNNSYFDIQKSKDGVMFDFLTRIDGAGNSLERLEYSTEDSNPYEGISYYRLKQVDFNGTFSYSKIISIEDNNDFDLTFDLIPNPGLDNNTKVVFNKIPNNEMKIIVYDVNGIVVYEATKILVGTNKIELPSEFAKGVYIVKVKSESKVLNKRLIVY